jgi:CBS domain-containing protein
VEWFKKRDPRYQRDREDRRGLAYSIIGISGAFLLVVSGLAIGLTDDQAGMSEKLFSAVLPLLGTWVGTVLAFYFSRSNFQAASDSMKQMTAGGAAGLKNTRLDQVMSTTMVTVKDKKAEKVKDVLKTLQDKDVRFAPVLTATGAVEFFLSREQMSVFEANNSGQTVEEMFNKLPSDDQTRAKTFVPLAPDDTLATAKAILTLTDNKVIFVTKSGEKNDPLIGVVTNTDIARRLSS